jgi:hypothetical protein
MPALTYQCPSTGRTLDVWYEIHDDPSESADGYFETVVCGDCEQVHLIDPKSGEVAGDGEK